MESVNEEETDTPVNNPAEDSAVMRKQRASIAATAGIWKEKKDTLSARKLRAASNNRYAAKRKSAGID